MTNSLSPKKSLLTPRAITIEEHENYVIARYDCVIIIAIRTTITADAIKHSLMASQKIIADRGRVVSLMIVGPNWKMPATDVINSANDAASVSPEQHVCVANVILGTGFVASTIRSMLTMIETVYARNKRKQETVRDLAGGASWITQNLNEGEDYRRRLIEAAKPFVEFVQQS
ncbi:MAG: hypothetical protein U0487_01945 [Patescibacteria group bacterium]